MKIFLRALLAKAYNRTYAKYPLFEALTEDAKKYGGRNFFRIYFRDPRFRAVALLRVGCTLHLQKFPLRKWLLRRLKNRLAVKYGLDTDFNLSVQPGLRIVHLGGIVVHRNSRIGRNLTIMNNVTLGQGRQSEYDVPVIGDNVFIGVGAVVLGAVSIGDNCVIGAQSLVNRSFGDGLTIVGTPGRILRQNNDL